mgnify:CR=1 FL=1|jgi:hypothetical protein
MMKNSINVSTIKISYFTCKKLMFHPKFDFLAMYLIDVAHKVIENLFANMLVMLFGCVSTYFIMFQQLQLDISCILQKKLIKK